jgi:hypothetical protein
MENNNDNFLKHKLSIDEMELGEPDLSLVQEAREKILARKKRPEVQNDLLAGWRSHFEFLFNPFPAGIAAILIIAGIFYFTNDQTQRTELAVNPRNAAANYSISSSSTVLASLTQYTNNKTATATSTVLNSIMTFVVKN